MEDPRSDTGDPPAGGIRVVVQRCFLPYLGLEELTIVVRIPRPRPGGGRARRQNPRQLELELDVRRPRSLHPAKVSLKERKSWIKLRRGWDRDRPKTRGDCKDGPRPCPWVSCRHSLFLSVNQYGSIKLLHPSVAPDSMDLLRDTCALDVADRMKTNETMPLEAVGRRLGMTLERTRQIQETALSKLRVLLTANASAEEDVDADEVVLRLRVLQ